MHLGICGTNMIKLPWVFTPFVFPGLYVLTIGQLYVGTVLSQTGQEDIHAFLELARKPPVLESWAKLRGGVVHKGNGKSRKRIPIEIRGHLTKDGITVQVIFNELERYLIKQKFNGNGDTTRVIQQRSVQEDLIGVSDVGLHPSDITLSFLYWVFVHEYSQERIRGQTCRVVKLQNPNGKESATVWLSIKYRFPLRVEWYRSGDRSPFRKLNFTGFEKVNEAWIIKEFKISGKDWKTIVKLKDSIVELVGPNQSIPNDLFVAD